MDLKRDFPHIIFHVNGQKTVPRTLGVGIDSFDHPVTIDWIDDQPRLLLANGRLLDHRTYKTGGEHEKWARLVGIQAHDDLRSIRSGPQVSTDVHVQPALVEVGLRQLRSGLVDAGGGRD